MFGPPINHKPWLQLLFQPITLLMFTLVHHQFHISWTLGDAPLPGSPLHSLQRHILHYANDVLSVLYFLLPALPFLTHTECLMAQFPGRDRRSGDVHKHTLNYCISVSSSVVFDYEDKCRNNKMKHKKIK